MSEKPKPQAIIEAHVMILPQEDGPSYVEVRTGSHGPFYKITEDDIATAVGDLFASLTLLLNPPPAKTPAAVEKTEEVGGEVA